MSARRYEKSRLQAQAYLRDGSQERFTLTDCDIVADTDAAILVRHDEHGDVWVPLSQVDKITRSPRAGASEVRMTAWIAKQKGFI